MSRLTMANFESIVSRESVLSFGVKESEWTEADQNLLRESMILLWKENPRWTEEEIQEACYKHVDGILFEQFKNHYGYLLQLAFPYESPRWCYNHYKMLGELEFMAHLKNRIEFNDFCQEFYDDLRSRYNICSAGMEDEFKRMKSHNWTLSQYRNYLNTDTKKRTN